MVAIILPVAFGTTLLADKVVLLVYGLNTHHLSLFFEFWHWVFLTYLNLTPVTTLNAMNGQRTVTKVVFLSMVLNVGLNFLLIPPLSYVGASVVMVLTEFLIFILLFIYARRFSITVCRFGAAPNLQAVQAWLPGRSSFARHSAWLL
jgi:O-antigen/teichoic acid export membrane protein